MELLPEMIIPLIWGLRKVKVASARVPGFNCIQAIKDRPAAGQEEQVRQCRAV